MNLKFQKFVGWTLLIAGVVIIFWSLYSSYNIFTTKAAPPEIFKVAEKETVLPKKGVQALQTKVEKMIREQLKGILPADSIPRFLNLITWSIFAGILIFGGAQIASLGIKLVKK